MITVRSRWRFSRADRVDREEDALYGEARGDELPEHLRTPEGRRAALKEAKRRLEQERAAEREQGNEDPAEGDGGDGLGLELDPEVIVARVQGRQGWLREARRQLDSRREQNPRPVPASRVGRLLVSEQKLAEDLVAEREG